MCILCATTDTHEARGTALPGMNWDESGMDSSRLGAPRMGAARIDTPKMGTPKMGTPKMDEAATAFAARFQGMLNDAMTVLMCSLGHRAGLFDAMADGAPRTSAALAAETGMDERYVREWLGAMVAGRIVTRDPSEGTHRLPTAHAASLSRHLSARNLAALARRLPYLGAMEDQVLACFREGGGVPYTAFPPFDAPVTEESGQAVFPYIVDAVVPLVPGLRARLSAGIEVLDLGCGQGHSLVRLARAFPASRFQGYELRPEAVADANRMARDAGLNNLRFAEMDLTRWDEPASWDWVMAVDAVHDLPRPDKVLAAVRRALRPRGVFLMVDFDLSSEPVDNIDHPMGAAMYAMSCMHCMTVSLAQGGLGLGAAWGVQLAGAMLRHAGFPAIAVHRLPHDTERAYFVMQT
jgi:SAM-dependent methyltransferase